MMMVGIDVVVSGGVIDVLSHAKREEWLLSSSCPFLFFLLMHLVLRLY